MEILIFIFKWSLIIISSIMIVKDIKFYHFLSNYKIDLKNMITNIDEINNKLQIKDTNKSLVEFSNFTKKIDNLLIQTSISFILKTSLITLCVCYL